MLLMILVGGVPTMPITGSGVFAQAVYVAVFTLKLTVVAMLRRSHHVW